MTSPSQLRAIDAFAGAGGLSLGLRRAGFDVRLAFDNDEVAVETHRRNLGDRVELLDATRTSSEQLMSLAGVGPGELDLLAGGPPCQGFSMQGLGVRGDPRNELVLRYLDWIRDIRPRAFLIENVPAIKSVRGRHLLDAVTVAARTAGLETHTAVLDASDFGVPQRRRRAFMVGVPAGTDFQWPDPTAVRPVSVRDAIGDLPSPPADGSPHPSVPNHFREARLSALNIERIKHVPEGGGRLHLPAHLQLECHKGGHRHLDTYGRLAWDEPAVTITARFDSFTRGRFGHPVEHRTITLREGARLQSFPDDFVFVGNRGEVARQIGNAVPPALGESVVRAIARALGSVLVPIAA